MRTTVELQAAVDSGAAWLDDNVPYWWKRIDLLTFDITRTCDCVLGQVFEDDMKLENHALVSDGNDLDGWTSGFSYACDERLDRAGLSATNLGFDTDASGTFERRSEFKILQELWTDKISERSAQ